MIVFVPTRERPQNAERLLKAWADTSMGSHLLFLVDEDDPALGQYLALEAKGAKVEVGAPKRIGPWLNEVAPRFCEIPEFIGFMGDDHVPRTPRWDVTVSRTLNQRPGIVYCNDLYMGEKLPTAVFMDNRIVAELGYMVPPGLLHWYMDDAWREWGKRADCLTYLPDVIIEHMHPGAGKAPIDRSYQTTSLLGSADVACWRQYEANQLSSDVDSIRRAIKEP